MPPAFAFGVDPESAITKELSNVITFLNHYWNTMCIVLLNMTETSAKAMV